MRMSRIANDLSVSIEVQQCITYISKGFLKRLENVKPTISTSAPRSIASNPKKIAQSVQAKTTIDTSLARRPEWQ